MHADLYRTGPGKRALLLLALIAGCTLSAKVGCKSPPDVELGPPPSRYQDVNLPQIHPRRVVLLPLVNQTRDNNVACEFGELLAGELRTRGAFDLVVPARAEYLDGAYHLTAESMFDNRLLAHIRQKYRADAVILGRINQYHAYWPPRISVSIHCVDTLEGVVLASVDGNWDARNKYIARQAEQFFTYLHPQDPLPVRELVLSAPNYFQKFVVYQIAERFLKTDMLHAP